MGQKSLVEYLQTSTEKLSKTVNKEQVMKCVKAEKNDENTESKSHKLKGNPCMTNFGESLETYVEKSWAWIKKGPLKIV